MDEEHELALDFVLRRSEALGVLDDYIAVAIDVYEVGDVADSMLNDCSRLVALVGNQQIGHLLAQLGYDSGALHERELPPTVVLLLGGMPANPPGMVLVVFAG